MKILRKRVIAVIIDSFIIGLLFEYVRLFIINTVYNFGSLSFLVVYVPFFLRDLLFKNASIGKKIMGLVILDDNWAVPKRIVLVIRALLMMTVGYLVLGKELLFTGEYITLFDWERETFKTRVIDKKVLARLQKEVNLQDEKYSSKMTQLYNEYLRNIYMK